jgi:hypothetical protein
MAVNQTLRVLSRAAIDFPLSAAIVFVLEKSTGLVQHLSAAPTDAQRAAFGAEAGVFGIIAGFAAAAIFAFAATDNALATKLRKKHGDAINRTLVGAFLTVVTTALASAAAVLLAPQQVASWLAMIGAILGMTKLLRVAALAWVVLETGNEEARLRPQA